MTVKRKRRVRVADRLSRFVQVAERAILFIGSMVLVLWLVEPTRAWLTAHHLVDMETIVGFSTLAILFMLHAFKEQSDRFAILFEEEEQSIIPQGVTRVYEKVQPLIDALTLGRGFHLGRTRRTLDILGIYLFTAWSNLQIYLDDARFTDFEISLACMEPQYALDDPSIPDEWGVEARARIEAIKSYLGRKQEELAARNVVVNLYLYKHLPAVHGFRIEKEEVFCSFIHWEGTQICKPFQFYEHFTAANRSTRAEFYRELFENWLLSACAGGPLAIEPDAAHHAR